MTKNVESNFKYILKDPYKFYENIEQKSRGNKKRKLQSHVLAVQRLDILSDSRYAPRWMPRFRVKEGATSHLFCHQQ